MGVAELVRREPASYSGVECQPAQLRPRTGCSPRATRCWTPHGAEEWTYRQGDSADAPRLNVLPTPVIHPGLAPFPTFAVTDEQGPANGVEIALRQIQGLLDSQAGPPEHGDQAAGPDALDVVSRLAHHRDDLLHARRVGREAPALVMSTAGTVWCGRQETSSRTGLSTIFSPAAPRNQDHLTDLLLARSARLKTATRARLND